MWGIIPAMYSTHGWQRPSLALTIAAFRAVHWADHSSVLCCTETGEQSLTPNAGQNDNPRERE